MKMEIKTALIKCDACGEMFMPGNDEKGLPNGIGIMLEKSNKIINLCSGCMMSSDFDSILKFVRKKLDEEDDD